MRLRLRGSRGGTCSWLADGSVDGCHGFGMASDSSASSADQADQQRIVLQGSNVRTVQRRVRVVPYVHNVRPYSVRT